MAAALRLFASAAAAQTPPCPAYTATSLQDAGVLPGYTVYPDARCTGRDEICGPGESPCDQAYTAAECAKLCERMAHCVSFGFRRCGAGAQREAGMPSMHCALSSSCTNMQADAVCLSSVLPRAPGGEALCIFPDGTANRGADCWDLYIRDGQYTLGSETGCEADHLSPVVADLECNTAATVLRLPSICSSRASIAPGCWINPVGLWWGDGGDGVLPGARAVCRLRCPQATTESGPAGGDSLTRVRATPEWGKRCCEKCEHNLTYCAPQPPHGDCEEAHPPVAAASLPQVPLQVPIAESSSVEEDDGSAQLVYGVFVVLSVLVCGLVILATCQHSSTLRHMCGGRNMQRFVALMPSTIMGAAQVETDAAPVSEREMEELSARLAVQRTLPPAPLPPKALRTDLTALIDDSLLPEPPVVPPPRAQWEYTAMLREPGGVQGSTFAEFVASTHCPAGLRRADTY
eukprot:TRINITY_DN12177_c2_g1_i1.p1 TRINITY_DN12177_c2_g1~~TRINITY_DN12177_c2_g1_i1.p1  ORF type:complete len:461 (+),score=48.57 TRINITY_DN12177_c2_g1_i1:141-1523(+)